MPTFREDLHLGHKVPLTNTDDIDNGAITPEKIAQNAVTGEKIADEAVQGRHIADSSVTHGKIADGAIVPDKIADNAINPNHVSPDTVHFITHDVKIQADDLQNQIDGIQIAGTAVSNEFGNDPHIALSQKKVTEAILGQQEAIDELESSVGEGGSVDTRIEQAKSDIIGDAGTGYDTLKKVQDRIIEERTARQSHEENVYTKSQTYSKSELNNLITTPANKVVSTAATALTTDVTQVLPATGSADTIYRVGCWDGTQYTTNVYSEYAWNGTEYQFLCAKDYGIDNTPTIDSNNIVSSDGIAKTLGHYMNNPEWLQVVSDSNGGIIEGIRRDGTKFVSGDLEVGGKIKGLDLDYIGHLSVVLENSGIDTNGIDQYTYASFNSAKRSAYYINLNSNAEIACSVDCVMYGYGGSHDFIRSIYVTAGDKYDVSDFTYVRFTCDVNTDSFICYSYEDKEMTQEKKVLMNADFDRLILQVDRDMYTAALITLPSNYTVNGKKVPLIIYDAGDGSYKDWNTRVLGGNTPPLRTGIEYMRDQGFAIVEIYSWGSYYYHKYYGCGSRSAMPIPTHIKTHEKGVEYVLDRYNIDENNIFHLSKSGSGKMALYYALVEPKFNLRGIYAMAPVFDDLNFGKWGMPDYRRALYEELNLIGDSEQVEQFRNGYETDPLHRWFLMTDPLDIEIPEEELEHLYEINQDFVRQNYAQFSTICVSWMNLVGQSPDEKFQDTINWGWEWWRGGNSKEDHENPDGQGNYPTYNRDTDIYNKHNLTMIGNHIPIKVIMAKDDEQTPYWSALEVINQLRNGGKDATLLPLASGGHAAPNGYLEGPNTVTDITTLLGVHYDAVPIGYFTAVDDIQKRFLSHTDEAVNDYIYDNV